MEPAYGSLGNGPGNRPYPSSYYDGAGGARGGGAEDVQNPFSPRPTVGGAPVPPATKVGKKVSPRRGLGRLARAGFAGSGPASPAQEGKPPETPVGPEPRAGDSQQGGTWVADFVAYDQHGRPSNASQSPGSGYGGGGAAAAPGAAMSPSVRPSLGADPYGGGASEAGRPSVNGATFQTATGRPSAGGNPFQTVGGPMSDNDPFQTAPRNDPFQTVPPAGVNTTQAGSVPATLEPSAHQATGPPMFGPDGLRLDESAAYARLMDAHQKRGDGIYGMYGATADAEFQRRKRLRFALSSDPISEWVGVDMADLLLPWALFVLLLVPFGLAYANMALLSWIAALVAFCVSSQLICGSKGRPWVGLSVLCLVASLLGLLGGLYVHNKYMVVSQIYRVLPRVKDVMPNSDPDEYRDAGAVQFTSSANIDSTRSVGMMSGGLYCVAPIVDPFNDAEQTVNGWWAVGKNCCKARNSFRCGDENSPTVHGGLVVVKESPFYSPNFVKAVRQASHTFGIPIPKEPMLVRWIADFDPELKSMWRRAVHFVIVTALCFLCIPIFLVILQVATGRHIAADISAGEAKEWEWHAREAAHMVFGFGGNGRPTRALQHDLVEERCYWSGEVLHDYVFYVANSSLFIGVIAAHPAHPLKKVERFILLFMICLLLVCIAAAFTALVQRDEGEGPESVVVAFKFVLALVFLLIPPALRKAHMQAISAKNLEAEAAGAAADAEIKDRPKLYLAISITTLVVFCICLGCLEVINATGQPVSHTVWMACDAVAYLFVLGLALDVWRPTFGGPTDCAELSRRTYFGFFGRWKLERESFLQAPEDFLWRSCPRYNELPPLVDASRPESGSFAQGQQGQPPVQGQFPQGEPPMHGQPTQGQPAQGHAAQGKPAQGTSPEGKPGQASV